jgi:hypothetical protein
MSSRLIRIYNMAKYSVFLEGENFPLHLEGETKLYGFYTTRRVTAKNEEEAELMAVDSIKSDPKLLSSVDRNVEAEPRIYMESIKKVGWWSRAKNTGYTFYPMESE